ncbi:DUF1688-domain-containing protein [Trametes versicolor FP-101664 SS1]|uniref:DUF1688-domain-containing protein n=1 Tax=Trametes versicolor (strain FP-101664) TaxID=717944 RepID=UPI0004623B28|nr:DUF1688-domain-containing protein [Trametes versicolor FP-101664 SS1]EIW61121.1 DUF1688-domain-containing protein [Trametes versicolor FP-101664 SS1]
MNPIAFDSPAQTAAYLRTLPAIRERCGRVHALAQKGELEYFEYHPEKESDAAAFCVNIIKRDFGTNFTSIPPHGRWQHLDAGRPRVRPLIAQWRAGANPPDDREVTRRLVDLFLVSVLLDAGAGAAWKYTEGGAAFGRSEGLGVASFVMFEQGFFSAVEGQPHRVDAEALEKITPAKVAAAMQVSEANPLVGLEGRTSLLVNLGKALKANATYFGASARPGNLIDFLETGAVDKTVHIFALWTALIDGLAPIWPATRSTLGGVSLGDVWPCAALKKHAAPGAPEGDDLVPFHKLTGWLTYSLVVPIKEVLGWKFEGLEHMVGLPEYRNGGLLLDLGVLSLRPGAIEASFFPDASTGIPKLPPSHPAIIEWRAMTVIELDRIADEIRKQLGGLTREQLSLAQVLESATWQGGREIAKAKRPATGGPPIESDSDGTVF